MIGYSIILPDQFQSTFIYGHFANSLDPDQGGQFA